MGDGRTSLNPKSSSKSLFNNFRNSHQINVRTHATKIGGGPVNPHQAIPGYFTRKNTEFVNILQDRLPAGNPSDMFRKTNLVQKRDLYLQLQNAMNIKSGNRKLRILVVEDEAAIRTGLIDVLV